MVQVIALLRHYAGYVGSCLSDPKVGQILCLTLESISCRETSVKRLPPHAALTPHKSVGHEYLPADRGKHPRWLESSIMNSSIYSRLETLCVIREWRLLTAEWRQTRFLHNWFRGGFVRLYLSAFAKLRKATINFLSVRPHGTTRPPTGQIVMKFDTSAFFEKLFKKFKLC
jgi:hypothetical protein